MTWTDFGRWLQFLYLIRVPLLAMAAMIALGHLAQGAARSLLGGVFALEGNLLGILSASLAAFLTAAAAVTTVNVVLWHGEARYGTKLPLTPHSYPLGLFVLGLLPPAYLGYCIAAVTEGPWLPEALMIIVGFLLAGLIVAGAKFLQLRFTDPGVTPTPPPYLIFPAYRIPILDKFFQRTYLTTPKPAARITKGVLSRRAQWLYGVFAPFGTGYFVPGKQPLTMYSAHVFAVSLTVLSLLVYACIGVAKQEGPTQGFSPLASTPTLTYALLALLVATWAFGALAFFFDRYRFPVLLAFGLMTFLTGSAPEADHYVATYNRDPRSKLRTPAEVIERYRDRSPLLVAAAGGGIQAGAWTATVMATLNDYCRNLGQCDLAASTALFSGVSGGSVGAMQIGAAWPNFEAARALSRKASLDDVAWGMLNPDVWRAILPWFRDPLIDRGWALENSWRRLARQEKLDLDRATLDTWGDPSKNMPAFLFNGTVVESGGQMVFATTTFPRTSGAAVPKTGRENPGAASFDHLYRGKLDLPITSAVRLSASFPYVSPSARTNANSMFAPDFHFVDGGYYDNYGLYTLMSWLNAALVELEKSGQTPRKLVILRIISFPWGKEPKGSTAGWSAQALTPLAAFYNMREAAQLVETEAQLSQFIRYWREKGQGAKVEIEALNIRYPTFPHGDPCADPPLSWRLTRAQQSCLDRATSLPAVQSQIAAVVRALQAASPQDHSQRSIAAPVPVRRASLGEVR
ncbi:MAG TPA: patatin-like phospholipase family protein [Bryobacteraceae bacterium]|nr:patatin-like phospholipase family protein [Bryobacteraceae bacterium]